MFEDHDEFRTIATGLRGLLRAECIPIGHRLAAIRWMLTRLLLRHVALPALRRRAAAGPFAQTDRARRGPWTPDRDWPAYRRETIAMLDTLDRDMVRLMRTTPLAGR